MFKNFEWVCLDPNHPDGGVLGAGVGLAGGLTIGLGIIAFIAWIAETLKHNNRRE